MVKGSTWSHKEVIRLFIIAVSGLGKEIALQVRQSCVRGLEIALQQIPYPARTGHLRGQGFEVP